MGIEKDLCLLAVDTATARGASYADVRLIQTRRQRLIVRNGALGEAALIEDVGLGVRAIASSRTRTTRGSRPSSGARATRSAGTTSGTSSPC